jgi:hypothetical protein
MSSRVLLIVLFVSDLRQLDLTGNLFSKWKVRTLSFASTLSQISNSEIHAIFTYYGHKTCNLISFFRPLNKLKQARKCHTCLFSHSIWFSNFAIPWARNARIWWCHVVLRNFTTHMLGNFINSYITNVLML